MNRTGEDWSRFEVEATVADYFEMFEKELRGEAYNKSEHRRRLMKLLDGRSTGAIEYKRQNISAGLIDLGLPYIEGYKPSRNYQALLFEVVEDMLDDAPVLRTLLDAAVDGEAGVPAVDDILRRMVDPPKFDAEPLRGYGTATGRDRGSPSQVQRNYLAQEARNASLGAAGEGFVLNFERARLAAQRRKRLAAQVEHVSVTRGDHLGFDVLSFEENGRERLIEVKTTAFGSMTPFFVTANQVETSGRAADRYHVYRLYRFRKDPEFFALQGSIRSFAALDATEFRATLR